jgi:hypothetical protein
MKFKMRKAKKSQEIVEGDVRELRGISTLLQLSKKGVAVAGFSKSDSTVTKPLTARD